VNSTRLHAMAVQQLEDRMDTGGQTLSTRIASRLRAHLMCGQIPPGRQLHLEGLRATLGGRRRPLRQGRSRLAAEGFVVMERQRGYRAMPVSEANLREVTKLRSEIEALALRESIRQGDDQWESELVASQYRLNKLEKARPTADGLIEWETAHR